MNSYLEVTGEWGWWGAALIRKKGVRKPQFQTVQCKIPQPRAAHFSRPNSSLNSAPGKAICGLSASQSECNCAPGKELNFRLEFPPCRVALLSKVAPPADGSNSFSCSRFFFFFFPTKTDKHKFMEKKPKRRRAPRFQRNREICRT